MATSLSNQKVTNVLKLILNPRRLEFAALAAVICVAHILRRYSDSCHITLPENSKNFFTPLLAFRRFQVLGPHPQF